MQKTKKARKSQFEDFLCQSIDVLNAFGISACGRLRCGSVGGGANRGSGLGPVRSKRADLFAISATSQITAAVTADRPPGRGRRASELRGAQAPQTPSHVVSRSVAYASRVTFACLYPTAALALPTPVPWLSGAVWTLHGMAQGPHPTGTQHPTEYARMAGCWWEVETIPEAGALQLMVPRPRKHQFGNPPPVSRSRTAAASTTSASAGLELTPS